MEIEAFLNQYYGVVAVFLFFVSYTIYIMDDVINNEGYDAEDYVIGFLVIGFCSLMWIVVLPFLAVVLAFVIYVITVRKVAEIYKQRKGS